MMTSTSASFLSGAGYPRFIERIPPHVVQAGKYEMRFARTEDELEAIARLRFNVFNVELDEGLDASFESGKDEDPFDRVCHHLMIVDRSGGVVGTYRLQTRDMAESGGLGFYSGSEFDLSTLPADIQEKGVELGRACIAKDHRSLQVLYLLWRGIGQYLSHNNCRYVFGCSSLTSQNPTEGHDVFKYFEREGHVHPSIRVVPCSDFLCDAPPALRVSAKPKVPRLMRVYLSLGAKVCSPPALDRMFKTIDYFTLFDTEKLTDQAQSYFMPSR